MDEFGALLAYPWKAKINGSTIVGQWAEDGSMFQIECPIQLAPLLIKLQNKLYEKNQEKKSVERKLQQINSDIDKVLG